MSLANGLSILFILSKNQLLALLIFAMVSFVSFAFISTRKIFFNTYEFICEGQFFQPNISSAEAELSPSLRQFIYLELGPRMDDRNQVP